jgi:hypothetical protein
MPLARLSARLRCPTPGPRWRLEKRVVFEQKNQGNDARQGQTNDDGGQNLFYVLSPFPRRAVWKNGLPQKIKQHGYDWMV